MRTKRQDLATHMSTKLGVSDALLRKPAASGCIQLDACNLEYLERIYCSSKMTLVSWNIGRSRVGGTKVAECAWIRALSGLMCYTGSAQAESTSGRIASTNSCLSQTHCIWLPCRDPRYN